MHWFTHTKTATQLQCMRCCPVPYKTTQSVSKVKWWNNTITLDTFIQLCRISCMSCTTKNIWHQTIQPSALAFILRTSITLVLPRTWSSTSELLQFCCLHISNWYSIHYFHEPDLQMPYCWLQLWQLHCTHLVNFYHAGHYHEHYYQVLNYWLSWFSSLFCQSHARLWQTDRPINRPCYFTCNNRAHLHTTVTTAMCVKKTIS